MEPRAGENRYHGFDTAVRDVGIYRGDLAILELDLDFPQLRLTIENRVAGHGIPAGGPSRVLVLEISLLDSTGVETHKVVEAFGKRFENDRSGLLPNKLLEDTQLRSGERRRLSFDLPTALRGRVSRARATLRFYEISDEHQGDLEKAHWISEPILEQTISF